jgi:hypothetical protein
MFKERAEIGPASSQETLYYLIKREEQVIRTKIRKLGKEGQCCGDLRKTPDIHAKRKVFANFRPTMGLSSLSVGTIQVIW